MAASYDQINKIKSKYESELEKKNSEISSLKEKLQKSEDKNDELRKKLYDVGEGKGEQHRLKNIINAQERENKTLQNQIKELSGEKLISTFIPERQELIKNIKKLHFNNSMFNSLALRFINGLDNVIEIAALIKKGGAEDMDFFTYVFRDNIVGLLEKMFKAVLNKPADSASKYLVNLCNGNYSFPKDYLLRIPNLKNKVILTNILYLINLQTEGYHGTQTNLKHVIIDKETNEKRKTDRFLNLSNKDQLDAIFTLLEFMYDVFTNKDHEVNLLSICSSWYKTLNF